MVWIKELAGKGRVLVISWDHLAIWYKVRYFHNSEAKEVFFLEDELEDMKVEGIA